VAAQGRGGRGGVGRQDAIVQLVLEALQSRKEERGRQALAGHQGKASGQRDAAAHQMAAWMHHPGLYPTPRPRGHPLGHPWVYQQAPKPAVPEPQDAKRAPTLYGSTSLGPGG